MANNTNSANKGWELLNSTNNTSENKGASLMGFTQPSKLTPEQPIQQQPQQEPGIFQKIGTAIGNLFNPIGEQPLNLPQITLSNGVQMNNLSKAGVSVDAGPAPMPVQETQAFKSLQANAQGQQDVVTRFASAGAAYQKMLDEALGNPQPLSKLDKELLKSQNLVDENGKTNISHLVAVTGQNAVDVAFFLAGSPLSSVEDLVGKKIAGDVAVKLAGKAYLLAPMIGRAISWGILGFMGTKNLDNLIKDPEVRKEAIINTIVGMGLGTITKIPESFFKSKYIADPAEVEKLYKDLAKEFHPGAGGNTEAFKKLTTLVEDVKGGTKSINELRALTNMTPEELASKAISKVEQKPTALLGNGEKPKPSTETPLTTKPNDLQTNMKANLENTNQKIKQALEKYDTGPVKEGMTRTYQVIEKGQTTPWVFDNEVQLRQFIGHNDISNSDIRIRDIPTNQLEKMSNGAFKVKGEVAPTELAGKTEPVTTIAPTKPASPKPLTPRTSEFQSRVFDRLKAEHPELQGDLAVKSINLDKEAEKAVKLLAEDKQKAYEIAMGAQESKDVTSTSVNIAMAERALEEGNTELYGKLVRNRSLAQTRRGQELVSEKGSITDNSTSRYVKELLSTRLENAGKKYLSGISVKKQSSKELGTKVLDREVSKLSSKIKNRKLDVKSALKLLEGLTCV